MSEYIHVPEDIKKKLGCYHSQCGRESCALCEFHVDGYELEQLCADALAYIHQLEQLIQDFTERTARLETENGCLKIAHTELEQLRSRIGSVQGFAEVGLEIIVNNFVLKETEKHLAYELAEVLLRDRLIEFWIENGEHSCPKMLRASLQVLHPQRGGNAHE